MSARNHAETLVRRCYGGAIISAAVGLGTILAIRTFGDVDMVVMIAAYLGAISLGYTLLCLQCALATASKNSLQRDRDAAGLNIRLPGQPSTNLRSMPGGL